MAPEVLSGEGYGSEADLYSFALVLAHMLTGNEPFHDVPPLEVNDLVLADERPKLPSSLTPDLRQLVEVRSVSLVSLCATQFKTT